MPHIVSTILAGSPGRTFSDILNCLLLEQNAPVIQNDILWALECDTEEGQPFLNGRFASELGRIALAPSSTGRVTTVEALRPHAETGIPAILLALSHVQALHLLGLATRLTHTDLLAGPDQAPWNLANIAYLGSAAKLAVRSLEAVARQEGSDADGTGFIDIVAETNRIQPGTAPMVFAGNHGRTMTEAVLRASTRLLARIPFDLQGGSMGAAWAQRFERLQRGACGGLGVQSTATFWLETARNIACWTPSTEEARIAWAYLEVEAGSTSDTVCAPRGSQRKDSGEQKLEIVSGWANICQILNVASHDNIHRSLRTLAQLGKFKAIRLGRKGKPPTANRADLERERDQIRASLNEDGTSEDRDNLESRGEIARNYASRRPGQSVPDISGTIKRRV